MELPHNLPIPLMGKYPKKMRPVCQTHMCTPMFIVAILTIAKKWKQANSHHLMNELKLGTFTW
jgi:hypothetical protein